MTRVRHTSPNLAFFMLFARMLLTVALHAARAEADVSSSSYTATEEQINNCRHRPVDEVRRAPARPCASRRSRVEVPPLR